MAKTSRSDIRFKYKDSFVSHEEDAKIASIPTGIANWDHWLFGDLGGLPLRRIVYLVGWEGSGKTTMGYHFMSAAQKAFENKAVGFVDMEQSGDPNYMKKIGVDISKLEWIQPPSGDVACQITLEWLKSKDFSLIFFDSIAAANSTAEMEKDVGDNPRMADRGALFARFCRKARPAVRQSDTCLTLTNQFYEAADRYGNSLWKEPASSSMKYYPSIRIWAYNTPSTNKGETDLGGGKTATSAIINWQTKKNQIAEPFRWAPVKTRFGKGVDMEYALLDALVRKGVASVGEKDRISIKCIDDKKRYISQWNKIIKNDKKIIKKLRTELKKVC